MKASASIANVVELACAGNHGKKSRKKLLPVTEASFACYVKSCAPPPAGKGGSSKAGTQARRLAEDIVGKARSAEGEVTNSLRTLVGEAGGTLVGLKHRVKGVGSLTRKIHDKAAQRGQTLGESAGKISDALRYTVAPGVPRSGGPGVSGSPLRASLAPVGSHPLGRARRVTNGT